MWKSPFFFSGHPARGWGAGVCTGQWLKHGAGVAAGQLCARLRWGRTPGSDPGRALRRSSRVSRSKVPSTCSSWSPGELGACSSARRRGSQRAPLLSRGVQLGPDAEPRAPTVPALILAPLLLPSFLTSLVSRVLNALLRSLVPALVSAREPRKPRQAALTRGPCPCRPRPARFRTRMWACAGTGMRPRLAGGLCRPPWSSSQPGLVC